jgi:hypothetical protein
MDQSFADWLQRYPIIKENVFLDNGYQSNFQELADDIEPHPLAVFEGIRSSGKSYTVKKISSILDRPVCMTWGSMGGLKNVMIDRSTGTSVIPGGIDVTSANIFYLDCLLQIGAPEVIFDRGYFSAMVFNKSFTAEKWDVYTKLLIQYNACIVYLHPPLSRIHETLMHQRNIPEEVIRAEEDMYLQIMQRVPKEIPVKYRYMDYETK